MKKILSFALAGMMLLSSFAAVASADEVERYKGEAGKNLVSEVQAYAFGDTKPAFEYDSKGNPTSETLKAAGAIDRSVWGEPTVTAKASEAANVTTAEPNTNVLFAFEKAFEDAYKKDKNTAANTPDGAWSKLEYNLWFGWDNDNLYVAAEIKDPDGYSLPNGSASIWNGDCLQFMIDPLGPNGVMKYVDSSYDYKTEHFDWWTYKRPWSNLNSVMNLGVGDVTSLKRNRYQIVNMSEAESGTILNDPKSARGYNLAIVNANENTVNAGTTVIQLSIPWNEVVETAKFAGNIALENIGVGYVLGVSASVLNGSSDPKDPEKGNWNSYLNWGSGVTGASLDPTAAWFPYVNPGSNAVVLSNLSIADHTTEIADLRVAEEIKEIEWVDQVMFSDLGEKSNYFGTDVDLGSEKNFGYTCANGMGAAVDIAITALDPIDPSKSCVGFWIGDEYGVYAAYDIVNKRFVIAKQNTSNGIGDVVYKQSDLTYDWAVANTEDENSDNWTPAEWGRMGIKIKDDKVELYFNGEKVLEDENVLYGHHTTTQKEVDDGKADKVGVVTPLENRSLILYCSAGAVIDNWVLGSYDYNLAAGDAAAASDIKFNFTFDTNDKSFNSSTMRGQAEANDISRDEYLPLHVPADEYDTIPYYAEKPVIDVPGGIFYLHVEGGTSSVPDANGVTAGTEVTVTAGEAPEGMEFDKWEVVVGNIEGVDLTAASITFAMPADNVELKAVFKAAYKLGDADGNGSVNARDITAIMKYIVSKGGYSINVKAADFDKNGSVNARDITAIMKAIVKHEV